MILYLLLLVPIVFALVSFFLVVSDALRSYLSLASALLSVILSLVLLNVTGSFDHVIPWIPSLNLSFHLFADNLSKVLILLDSLSFLFVFILRLGQEGEGQNRFDGLMLLAQVGITGVFLAKDSLLFYFFWEFSLVPIYFLTSTWGGKGRIKVSFKFFIYTVVGSLLLLIGILTSAYSNTEHSFSWEILTKASLPNGKQNILFWLFFIAFAIKMPIFPLHTWQPSAYKESPTYVTMILSAVMVKMGLYGVLRWLFPLFPQSSHLFANTIILFSIIGIVYASVLAIKQNNMKVAIAYSSMAHIGLMNVALFCFNQMGYVGAIFQMFSHGIIILGMWAVALSVENHFGTTDYDKLGGIAKGHPSLTAYFVFLAFANVALPLMSSFIGEFLMLNGVYTYSPVFAVISGLSVILSAVYTLNIVKYVFLGKAVVEFPETFKLKSNYGFVLAIIVLIVCFLGVYPSPILDLAKHL